MADLPQALRALGNDAVVTEEEPHLTFMVEPTAPRGCKSHPHRPCHQRAIHSSPDRFPADNHGQRQGCFKLRCCLSSQVIVRPDLALQAGGQEDWLVTLTRNSHALTTPPTRLATAAGISQYRPPPAFSRKLSPATPTSTAVIVLGENRSMMRATP
jgi:hypothetical protein